MDLENPRCQRPQHQPLNLPRPLLVSLSYITLASTCQALGRAHVT